MPHSSSLGPSCLHTVLVFIKDVDTRIIIICRHKNKRGNHLWTSLQDGLDWLIKWTIQYTCRCSLMLKYLRFCVYIMLTVTSYQLENVKIVKSIYEKDLFMFS